MAIDVPTTAQLTASIISNFESALSQTIPLLPRSFLRVLAKVSAGKDTLLQKYAARAYLDIFAEYASFEWTEILGTRVRPLVELGRLYGVSDPTEATRAELEVDLPVINQTGSLPAFSQFTRDGTNIVYTSTSEVLLNAASVTVPIVAASDPEGNGGSGTAGNLQVGDVVTLANALANVGRDATVTAQTTVAEDAETPDAYRLRVKDRIRKPPQGGAYADYELWAKSVAGIIGSWPYTGDDPGEVDAYCEATVASSGSDDGIPTTAQLTAVFDAIQLEVSGKATRRPIGAAVNVLAIDRTPFTFWVSNFEIAAEFAASTRTQISEGLDEYLRTREPFIVGLSVLPRKDRITAAEAGGIVSGIAQANGGSVSSVALVEETGSLLNAYTLQKGEKSKLSTVVYI